MLCMNAHHALLLRRSGSYKHPDKQIPGEFLKPGDSHWKYYRRLAEVDLY